jgi:hypothetical protein
MFSLIADPAATAMPGATHEFVGVLWPSLPGLPKIMSTRWAELPADLQG